MIVPLVYYGDPRLRKRCHEVREITAEIKRIAQDLIDTMFSFPNGIGLSAPQIGYLVRMFVISLDYPEETPMTQKRYQLFINPQIVSYSSEVEVETEGCLSLPGIYEEIVRPIQMTIKAMDLQGRPFQEDASGIKARMMMHENDHLNGVLTIDRIGKKRRKQIDPLLNAIKEKHFSK